MREAVGGTWLMYFFFTFIFVYVAFIAIIMNYASAYRATNYVVSSFENTEGAAKLDDLKTYARTKYQYNEKIDVCCKSVTGGVGSVYHVTSYVAFEIPLIGIKLDMPIKVESKTIYNTSCVATYSRCQS